MIPAIAFSVGAALAWRWPSLVVVVGLGLGLLGIGVSGPPRVRKVAIAAGWLLLGQGAAWVPAGPEPPRVEADVVAEVLLDAAPLDRDAALRPARLVAVWTGIGSARWTGEADVLLRVGARRLRAMGRGSRLRVRGRLVVDRRGRWVLRVARTPIDVIGAEHLSLAVAGVHRARRRIRRGIGVVGPRAHGLFLALALGDTSQLDAGDRQAFSRTGTAHLLAISGLHVGICWAAATAAARWGLGRVGPGVALLRRGMVPGAAGVLGWGVAAAYVVVAGAPVSGRRALAMLAVLAMGRVLWRRASPWNVLAAAVMVVVGLDPSAPRALGFQLSVASVAFLLAWTPLERREGRLRRAVGAAFATGALGTLATAPLIGAVWGQVPVAGVWVNGIAVPLLGVLLVPLVLLGAGLGAVDPDLGRIVWPLAEGVAALGLRVVRWCAEPSRAPLVPWTPPGLQVALFYAVAGLAAFLRRAR